MKRNRNEKNFQTYVIVFIYNFFSFITVQNVDWPGSGTEAAISNSQSDKSTIDKKSKKIKSERKKRMKGEYQPDQPDMFVKLHREIRTGIGESQPSYKPNYKFEEFERSIKNISPLRKSSASITWQERGPGNVGGRTRGLVVDIADATKQTWFAAAVSGGIWKTTNAGTDWEEKTFTLPNLATTCIVQSVSNPDVLYAGTGEGFYNVDAISGDGVFKSTDHGETWAQLNFTAGNNSFNDINRIVVDPNDENIVVLCANGSGIQKSVNGGETWTSALTGTSRVQQIVANPNSFDTLYAAIDGTGVYKSTDGGSSWLNSSTGLTVNGRIEIAVAKSNPDYLYASVDNASSTLFISTNAGANWKLVSASGQSFAWLGQQGWYDNTIQVHPFNEKIVYLGGIDLYRTVITDELTTAPKYSGKQISYWFTSPNSNYVHADQHNIQMIETGPTTYRILVGNDGGVFYSDNEGTSWTEVNNGYNTTQFYGCDKKHGAEEFIGGMQDNGTWQSPLGQVSTASSAYLDRLGGDGYIGNFKYDEGNKLLGAIYYDAIYKSTDNGVNWFSATQGLTDAALENAPFITVIAKTNSDPDLLFTTGGSGIWRSDNFADDWILSEMDQAAWGYSGMQTPVEISLADPQIVWAGASMSTSKKLQLSTDGGLTFSSTNNYASLGTITNIASHPTDKNTAFVVLSLSGRAKILRTTDLGQSWADITQFATGTSANGFPDVAVYDFIVMPYDTNIYWAFTEIGIFESVDEGANWNYLNDPGFPAVAVWRADIVDDMVVMSTHGRGIWTARIDELASYTPPQVTLSPVLSPLGQNGGQVVIPFKLRSVYDSTNIYVNNEKVKSILVNEIKDEIFSFTYTSSGVMTVSVSSFKDGVEYKSSRRSIEVVNFNQPQLTSTRQI